MPGLAPARREPGARAALAEQGNGVRQNNSACNLRYRAQHSWEGYIDVCGLPALILAVGQPRSMIHRYTNAMSQLPWVLCR